MGKNKWWILLGAVACFLFGGFSWLIAYVIVMVGAKILSNASARREVKAILCLIGIGFGYYKAGWIGAIIIGLLIGWALLEVEGPI